MTAKSRKTTHPREGNQTVAEEGAHAHEDQTVAEPTAEVVEEPTEAVAAESAAPNDVVEVADTDKGYCDNHPNREAVLVVDMPWTTKQRFCNLCIPSQYRYLMP